MNVQDLNIRFVEEVEKYPCLYNYKLTDYSRKEITDRAWSTVGEVFNMTESQCKEKWKNLRAVFVRHLKPGPNGSSKTRKPYYLNDAMQFTIPFIRALNTEINTDSPVSFSQVTIKEEIPLDQEDDEEAEEMQTFLPPTPTPPSNDRSCNQRKRKPCLNFDEVRQTKLQKSSEDSEDPKRMFLLSLLPDIKEMTECQMRTFKRRVMALVDEILDEID